MDKYTYSNLIIDPTKEGIESLIGKEVYFHDNPSLCLENANENSTSSLGILVDIFKNSAVPFRVEQKCIVQAYSCIIEKKEKAKYVPFESADEFINAFDYTNHSVEKGSVENKLINYGGIWLKDKDIDDVFYMVTEIWRDGVVLGSDQSTTKWDDLLYGYTFIDGSHCGKEVKE